MTFVCECGFQTELSAKQLDRVAAAGGRVKCPQCGKSAKLSVAKPTKTIIDTAQDVELFAFNEVTESQPVTETMESESVVVPSVVTTTTKKNGWNTKDKIQIAACSLALLLSLVGVLRSAPSSKGSDSVAELEKRIEELESQANEAKSKLTLRGRLGSIVLDCDDKFGPTIKLVDGSGHVRIRLFAHLVAGLEVSDRNPDATALDKEMGKGIRTTIQIRDSGLYSTGGEILIWDESGELYQIIGQPDPKSPLKKNVRR